VVVMIDRFGATSNRSEHQQNGELIRKGNIFLCVINSGG